MNLLCTVGISGSGKSTFVSRFLESNPYYSVISPDLIRKKLTGSVSDQTKNYEVWQLVYSTLKEGLRYKDIILDSTLCNVQTIKEIVKIVTETNSTLQFKILFCNPVIAYKRICKDIEKGINRSNVPYEVIKKQYEGYKEVIKFLNNYVTI